MRGWYKNSIGLTAALFWMKQEDTFCYLNQVYHFWSLFLCDNFMLWVTCSIKIPTFKSQSIVVLYPLHPQKPVYIIRNTENVNISEIPDVCSCKQLPNIPEFMRNITNPFLLFHWCHFKNSNIFIATFLREKGLLYPFTDRQMLLLCLQSSDCCSIMLLELLSAQRPRMAGWNGSYSRCVQSHRGTSSVCFYSQRKAWPHDHQCSVLANLTEV